MRTDRTTPPSRTTKPSAVKAAATTSAAKPRASRTKKPAAQIDAPNGAPTEAVVLVITEEMIAVRAYEIYLGRNGAEGDPLSDWAQAERELRGE